MTSFGIFLSCRRESHTSASKGWRFPTIVHFSFSRDSPESVSSLRLRQPLWRSACSSAVNNAGKIQICGLSLCQIFCRMLISFFDSVSGFLTKISHLLSCQSFVVSICCYIIIHYSGGKQQSKMSEERLRKTKQFTRRIKKQVLLLLCQDLKNWTSWLSSLYVILSVILNLVLNAKTKINAHVSWSINPEHKPNLLNCSTGPPTDS